MHSLLIFTLMFSVIVSARSEANTCFGSIRGFSTKGHTFARTFENAWRTQTQRTRSINVKAMTRVITDKDLRALAETWMRLKSAASKDPDLVFFDLTFQFLLFVGDVRLKFAQEPLDMFGFIQRLILAKERGVDVHQILPRLEIFLDKFTNIEKGMKLQKWETAFRFFDQFLSRPLHGLIPATI